MSRQKIPSEKGHFFRDLSQQIKHHKSTFAVYIILRTLVIAAIVVSCIQRNYENLFVCVLSLILFMLPAFVEKNFRIELPSTLEIIILLFIFAAEILGELQSYYLRYTMWDTMLHTINGFLCAAFGFGLVDILNRNARIKFSLSPLYLAVAAFCFSMTIGVLWEFGECAADLILRTDAQKDMMIHSISTVALDPTLSNTPVQINDITQVIIKTADGTVVTMDGYLDIGLLDTMKDLFVNFIGAIVFCIIGYFFSLHRGKGRFAKHFIPTLSEESSGERQEKSE